MAKKWRLTTWTKGTGAFIEPLDGEDRPKARARPGGLAPSRRTGSFSVHASRPDLQTDEHRTEPDARRRHALRHLDAETLDKLESLERALGERDVAA
jgi:hypothetical protein